MVASAEFYREEFGVDHQLTKHAQEAVDKHKKELEAAKTPGQKVSELASKLASAHGRLGDRVEALAKAQRAYEEAHAKFKDLDDKVTEDLIAVEALEEAHAQAESLLPKAASLGPQVKVKHAFSQMSDDWVAKVMD